MRHIASLVLLSSCAIAAAQHDRLTGYDWEATPATPDVSAYADRSVVLLDRHIRGQFLESGEHVYYYELFHMRMYLADQSAVEGNSTVDLPMGHVNELLTLKARSVAPDGTVHELAQDAFKRSEDERDGSSRMYFAFEGLLPGSTVEYLMLALQRNELQGEVTRLQFRSPVQRTSYELLVPADWKYDFKGYNGAGAPAVDSSLSGILRHHIELKDLPPVDDEPSATPERYSMYLVGKLDGSPARNVRDYSGYISAARSYNRRIYPPLEKGTQRALATVLQKMHLDGDAPDEDRIRAMDEHIRTNFRMAGSGSGDLDDLDQVLRTGNANELGMQRLYANLFHEAGVDHQLVITCDRTGTPFDKDFQCFSYLHDLGFFFPTINKYLDPTQLDLGLGYLPWENMGTHGLFVRNVVVNDVPTGLGTVKYIEELPAAATHHDLDISVTFTPDATAATVELKNDLTGYYAGSMQNFWPFLDEEQRAELIRDQFSYLTEGADAHEITVANGEHGKFGILPLEFTGTVTTQRLCGRAGEDIFFKVGELIGPQSEMYAEKDRKLPVDVGYNRYYRRHLRIMLPAGWTVDEIGGLTINKKLGTEGKVLAEFKSTATLEGDTLTVEANEYYECIHVPLEQFEDYRAVINAAADFNKQAILLRRAK